MRRYAELAPEDDGGRAVILRELLGQVGVGAYVEPALFVDYGVHVFLGARDYLNTGCVLLDCARIVIGDDAFFGPGVHVYTATHPLDPEERARGPELARPVRIGAKSWIGGAVVILPGSRSAEEPPSLLGASSRGTCPRCAWQRETRAACSACSREPRSQRGRRRHLACDPAFCPRPTCGTRATSRKGRAPGTLRSTEVQRMVIARHVLR